VRRCSVPDLKTDCVPAPKSSLILPLYQRLHRRKAQEELYDFLDIRIYARLGLDFWDFSQIRLGNDYPASFGIGKLPLIQTELDGNVN
jgi:hypothetical protein